MKIRIKYGSYGYRPNGDGIVKTVSRGECAEASDAEARRLVGMGIAEVVGDPVYSAGMFEWPAEEDADFTAAPVATPQEGDDGTEAGENPPEDDEGAEGEESDDADEDVDDADEPDDAETRFTEEALMEMTRTDLETLAADLGADAKTIKACKKKSDLVAFIVSAEDDDEEPPVTDVEAPVV